MSQKSISEETLKIDCGVNTRTFLLKRCQNKRNKGDCDILSEFVAKSLGFFLVRSKIKLLQC